MNQRNERQHYVSKVLLKRFQKPGHPLECYQITTGMWKPRSIERCCSAPGYNQILVGGDMNNALEDSFSRVESDLPEMLKSLEKATGRYETILPEKVYRTLCNYCTFLLGTSLFAKPGAVATFLAQLNFELANNRYYLFRELKTPESVIAQFRSGYLVGGRIIIESENVLQTVFRLQFERNLNYHYSEFVHSSWTISSSPLELPMSDIGLIEMRLDDMKMKHYVLPIGPRLVLEAIWHFDSTKNSPNPVIKGFNLTDEEAEYRLDCICSSAVLEVVCSDRTIAVAASRARAKQKGFKFNRIAHPMRIRAAGLKNASSGYTLRMVSQDDYRAFVHSFIQPPEY